jgi:adenosylcobinamide-GDP ribazoletransferase
VSDDTQGVRAFSGAVSFLTVLGSSGAPSSQAMAWFPVVGALLGGIVGLIWWGSGEWWPPLLAAVIAIVADIALTGALHHDGLADAADGLLPHMDRDRRLAVMRQPDIGAFGVMALVSVTLVRVGALAVVHPEPAVIAGVWCASRTSMTVIARTVSYARPSGLASEFLGGSVAPVALLGTVLALGLAVWGVGIPGIAIIAAVALTAAAVVALSARRIGGFTGDVLGAAGLLGESAGLLVMAARW